MTQEFPPRNVQRTDMEIVKTLLKASFGVDAETPSRVDFHLPDIFFMTTTALHVKVVVELGTGMGVSCGAFVRALKHTGGTLYSVDIHPEAADVKPTIEKYSQPEYPVVFITGNSITVGEQWRHGDIDVLYCDSAHSYEHVLNELTTWNRFHPKVIFVHDTLDQGQINEPYNAAEEFARRSGKKFVNLTFTGGLGIII